MRRIIGNHCAGSHTSGVVIAGLACLVLNARKRVHVFTCVCIYIYVCVCTYQTSTRKCLAHPIPCTCTFQRKSALINFRDCPLFQSRNIKKCFFSLSALAGASAQVVALFADIGTPQLHALCHAPRHTIPCAHRHDH